MVQILQRSRAAQEKSTATGHVKSAGHKRHKLAHTTRVFKPGAAAVVLDAPKSTIVEGTESSTSATETAPPPKRVVVGDGGK